MEFVYFIFAVFCTFVIVELWALIFGWKKLGFIKSQLIAVISPIVLAPVTFILFTVIVMMFSTKMNYHPDISDKSVLLGEWIDDNYSLTLGVDGKFNIQGNQINNNGYWSLSENILRLNNSPYDHLRIITIEGKHTLLKNTFKQDPDSWYLYKGFVKK